MAYFTKLSEFISLNYWVREDDDYEDDEYEDDEEEKGPALEVYGTELT